MPPSQLDDEDITIKLSPPDALVLFEFISRFSNDSKLEIQDRSEAQVLQNICCDLERRLVEPFKPDYAELLEKARNAIKARSDSHDR